MPVLDLQIAAISFTTHGFRVGNDAVWGEYLMMRQACLGLIGAFALSATTHASNYEPKPINEILQQTVQYDSSIPTPVSVTGYELGEIIYTPDLHKDYIEALDAASDRVSVDTIGYSHFGRPIIRITITSERNQERLDEIRANQIALTQQGASPAGEDHPLLLQLTHGVHGSEPSSYDAALALMYYFAAAQSDSVNELLDEIVINQYVSINPDGTNRFAQWTNDHHAVAPVADPSHREHFYEWPWGRTNHYWFDLNRQWLPVTQPESQAIVRETHAWMPNLAIDFHEMGRNSTFFFSPGPLDGLHPLLSQDGLQLNIELNEALEDQLDSEGAVYVAEELFDDFYLGYGSSYPGLLGSIPYLFEQSSVRGIIQETEYGTLRYDDKIGEVSRVALALIRSAHTRRADLQAHLLNFYNESRQMAVNDPVRGYVFSSSDHGRLNDFLEMLDVHQLEVRELNQTVRLAGQTFEPGEAYVVPVRQDQYRVVQGIFESEVIEDKTEFYDVSGWTQPMTYGLDYAVLRSGFFSNALTGDIVSTIDRSAPVPPQSDLAYVMKWDSYYAPRALYRLLNAGVRARVIPDETRIQTPTGEAEAGRGAIMIPVSGQPIAPDAIYDLIVKAAEEDSVTIHPATTASTAQGSDLGGFALSNVEKPVPLLISGRGTSMYSVGEMWHLLDHEMEIPTSMIDLSEFGRADLSRYTHIFVTNGNYSALNDHVDALKAWVRAGGVLVAHRAGARWAVENEFASAQWLSANEDESGSSNASPPSYKGIDAWDAEISISGALFNTDVDVTHPLAFGLRSDELPVHKIGSDAFAITNNPFASPVRFTQDDPILSGYASPDNRAALAGSGMMHAERVGSGSVILFSDNPVYRAYMKGSARLMTNTLFFGDDFRNPRRRTD
jgi:hypothetical protein